MVSAAAGATVSRTTGRTGTSGTTWSLQSTAVADLWRFVCRASYFISLLGLKIPLGLLARASRARLVLGAVVFAWVPFLACCHVWLLPKVQGSGITWQVLTAIWLTIPLLTVGAVILFRARGPKLFAAFFGALSCMLAFHYFAIPAFAGTRFGALLLHAFFAFFEDMPIIVWIWCLAHVVRLQDHIRARQSGLTNPFAANKDATSGALIVGNAPSVTEGEPLGAAIDGFADVTRFNSYNVDRPEFTGSKVGFHFCNGRNFPTTKTVKAVCPLFNASLTHAVYLFMPHAEEAADIYRNLTSSKVDAWFVAEEEILELRKKIGCRLWQIPTSGMVAINAFLLQRPSVTLHGFNFFQGKKIHYFEESPTQLITSWLERFVTHDPSREKVWVQDLVRQGRAAFLAPPAEPAAAEAEAEGEAEEAASPKSAEWLEEKVEKMGGGCPEKKTKKDGEPRRRPGLVQTLLKDGLPSQFSL